MRARRQGRRAGWNLGEEADGGYAGGSGGEAGGGILFCDAAEGEDVDWGGGAAGGGQELDASAGGGICGDCFLEDRAEEDKVGPRLFGWGCRMGDFLKRMAREADGGGRQADVGVELADLRGSEGAGAGGEVDAVGVGGDGDVGTGVDEEFGWGVVGAEDGEDLAGEVGEGCGGEVFFAELEEVDVS